MSKKQHDKQLAKARSKRTRTKYDRQQVRNRTIIIVMVVLMALSLVAVPLASLFSRDAQPTIDDDPSAQDAAAEAELDPTAEPETTEGPCGEASDDVPEITSTIYDEPFELTIDPDATYVATIATTCGDIVIELDAQNAPQTVNNLVNLAQDGYYDGVPFHRVVPGFVIQVGDPAGTGCGQDDCMNFDPDAPSFPGYTFGDELELAETLHEQVRTETADQLRAAADAEGEEIDEELFDQLPGGYPRGTVAMANAGADTNGSQFFIAQGDPTSLPGPNFSVFGTVTEGMDVVDDIAASPTDEASRPFETVAIRSISIDQR